MAITTTAAQIAAAVNAKAGGLVTVTNHAGNDGTGAVTVMPVAALAGGDANTAATLTIDPAGSNNSLDFTAVAKGTDGNKIKVLYVDPGDGSPLDVLLLDGRTIYVILGDAVTVAAFEVDGFHTPYRSGKYYLPVIGVTAAGAMLQNELYAIPFFVATPTAFDRLAINALGNVVNSQARVGIYDDNQGVPNNLIVDGGVLDTTQNGQQDAVIAVTLARGWYWLAVAVQGTAHNHTATIVDGGPAQVGFSAGVLYQTGVVWGYSRGGVSGALPAAWGATYTERERVIVSYLRAK